MTGGGGGGVGVGRRSAVSCTPRNAESGSGDTRDKRQAAVPPPPPPPPVVPARVSDRCQRRGRSGQCRDMSHHYTVWCTHTARPTAGSVTATQLPDAAVAWRAAQSVRP